MHFEYPHRYYLGGYLFFIFTEGYGLYILHDSPLQIWWKFLFLVVFALLFLAVRKFYRHWILFLKSFSITVGPEDLEGLFRGEPYRYRKDQIKSIYYTREVVRFKLFHVIHIFTLDGDHIYFSNEILKFKRLKALLLESYPHLIYPVQHLMKDSASFEEDHFYLAYLKNKD